MLQGAIRADMLMCIHLLQCAGKQTLVAGDTLSAIAEAYNVSLDALMGANPAIRNPINSESPKAVQPCIRI